MKMKKLINLQRTYRHWRNRKDCKNYWFANVNNQGRFEKKKRKNIRKLNKSVKNERNNSRFENYIDDKINF